MRFINTIDSTSNLEKAHILIIDDIADNIQVAMNILKEDDYGFSFATSGEEGVALVKESPEKYDLILLDVMMPGIDGFETCKQIKESQITRDIPIIFLTARVEIDAVSKGFAIGGVDYITKPFHPEELLARVNNHLELYFAKKLLKQNNISLIQKAQITEKRLLTELEQNQQDIIFMLTELMEASSDETGKHIRRLSEISAVLAKHHPALTPDDEQTILHAAPMHDIGKMLIPHNILHKPQQLTDEEFELMKTHTSQAYNLLKNNPRKLMKASAIIANQHHEKWDGSGYPQQLQGNDIHIYGRIVAIADVYDALTHKRCYKDAWTSEEAFQYIKDKKGTHFDPELVDIFEANFDEIKAIK